MSLHYFPVTSPPLRSGYHHRRDPFTASSRSRKHPLPSNSNFKINAQPLATSNTSPKPPPLPSLLKTLNSTHFQSIPTETLGSLLSHLTPKEQTVVLKSQRNLNQLLLIFDHFRSQLGYTPNPIHYNIVLRVLGKAQKWDELRVYWVQMAKDGIFPTNNTYAMLIDVFGKAGLVKEALLWLKHMKSRGVFPDEVTMNTVVRVLKDSGWFDVGERFFRGWCDGRVELDVLDVNFGEDDEGVISPKQFLLTEMFKSGGRAPVSRVKEGSMRKNKPRLAATYNTLIDLYGKAGKLQDASGCFREMLVSGVEPDAFTFNTMIHICGSHGQLSEAESLLQKMEERRIKPDTKTYNIFMSLYASVGDTESVLRYYKRIKESSLRHDIVTYRIILQVLCEKKMVSDVKNVIEEIMALGASVDEQCLPIIMRMYVDEGLLDEASIFFEKYCFGREISSKNYAAIIDAYAEKEYWKQAENVFSAERSGGQKKDAVEYNVMIKAYGKAKLYDKALTLFEGMRACGTWPDECTYNSLIQMLCAGDLLDRARELLRKMKEAGFRPRCETYSALISGFSHTGVVSEAVEIYREMKTSGVEPNEVVFGSLIDGFAESARIDEALNYFQVMEASGLTVNRIVLTSLIKAYSKAGCWKEAQEVYAKIKNLDGGPDTIASNCMINLYANLGMVNEAKLMFDDLRRNGQADGVSYATMMYLYKNMGLLEEATDIAHEAQISGLLTDCASYNNVMASYADRGKLKECVELLHQMLTRRILPDASTFKTLFTILKKGGLAPEAVSQLESSYIDGKPFARQAIITFVLSMADFHSFALESCEAFMKAEVPLDTFAYNAAIRAYGAADEVDKALNVFMKMQDEGLEPDLVTYIYLAACYGKAGMLEGLRRIYGLLKYGDIEPNQSLYKALIDAYENAGKEDLAKLVDQDMRFSIYAEEGFGCDSSATVDILSHWDTAKRSIIQQEYRAMNSDKLSTTCLGK